MKLNNVTYEMSAGTFKQLPECTMPEIVFSGRSNVGKSSLINKVLNRKSLARVSSQPGKTVTINFYRADSGRLVDLPGYGYAKTSFSERNRWGEMIEKYFQSDRDIRLVAQLIDMRHKPTKDDLQMLDFLYQMQIPYVVVLTKSDKLNKTEYAAQLELITNETERFEPLAVVPFSAVKGEGVETIRQMIISAADGNLTTEKPEESPKAESSREPTRKSPIKVQVIKKKDKR